MTLQSNMDLNSVVRIYITYIDIFAVCLIEICVYYILLLWRSTNVAVQSLHGQIFIILLEYNIKIYKDITFKWYIGDVLRSINFFNTHCCILLIIT